MMYLRFMGASLSTALCFVFSLSGVAWGQNVAFLQLSSYFVMEDAVRGQVEGLRSGGIVDGEGATFTFYNAQGDVAEARRMAEEIVAGEYDLIMTVSTQCLEAVAEANLERQGLHAFAAVVNPAVTTAGIGEDLSKPVYMTGVGTPQPIESIFAFAKEAFPALERVGVVWNPSESQSGYSLNLARGFAEELGFTLIDETIDDPVDISRATSDAIARGAQAIWVGSDNSVNNALPVVIEVANAASVPVFTMLPNAIDNGALFDLGADYYQVGVRSGEKAVALLGGAEVDIELYTPEALYLNLGVLGGLADPWTFSEEMIDRAARVIGESNADAWELYR